MKVNSIFAVQILFQLTAVFAQVPSTDIWLMDIASVNSQCEEQQIKNITNREGYDNQPAFSPDGKYILYSAIYADKKAHIYRYDIATGAISLFTRTQTSEYSPTFMPDGKNLSVLRVESDSAQRIWRFPLTRGEPARIMEIDSIGYYAWISQERLALNVLTKPFTLQVTDVKKQVPVVLKSHAGRCLQKYKNGILFTTLEDSVRWIYFLDDKNKLTPLVKTLPGSEDYCVLGDRTILMGKGTSLYKYEIGGNKDWELFSDLACKNLGTIGRLAVSGDGKKLAIVGKGE